MVKPNYLLTELVQKRCALCGMLSMYCGFCLLPTMRALNLEPGHQVRECEVEHPQVIWEEKKG